MTNSLEIAPGAPQCVPFKLGHLKIRERLHQAMKEHPLLLIEGQDVARLGIRRLLKTVSPYPFYAISTREDMAAETCLCAFVGHDPETVHNGMEAMLGELAADKRWVDTTGSNRFADKLQRVRGRRESWLRAARANILRSQPAEAPAAE